MSGIFLALALAAAPGVVELHLALDRPPHGSAEERRRVRDLQYELMARLAETGAGAVAGDAWKDGFCVLRLEGADPRALWAAVEPAVTAFEPRRGSFVLLKAKGDPPVRIPLGTTDRRGRRPTPPS